MSNAFVRRLCSVTYHLFGHWFPDSYYEINLFGHRKRVKIGYRVRGFLASKMIKECGKKVNIERYAQFNKNIHLGDYSGIGRKCAIGGGTYIGDHVMMAPEVIIYTQNHEFSRTDITMDRQGFREPQPVYIGNDVWIGRRVMIMPGAVISDGYVIGAGAVVAGTIPPYSVAVGNPARVVKTRTPSDDKAPDSTGDSL